MQRLGAVESGLGAAVPVEDAEEVQGLHVDVGVEAFAAVISVRFGAGGRSSRCCCCCFGGSSLPSLFFSAVVVVASAASAAAPAAAPARRPFPVPVTASSARGRPGRGPAPHVRRHARRQQLPVT